MPLENLLRILDQFSGARQLFVRGCSEFKRMNQVAATAFLQAILIGLAGVGKGDGFSYGAVSREQRKPTK
jgi:hypothetical protein